MKPLRATLFSLASALAVAVFPCFSAAKSDVRAFLPGDGDAASLYQVDGFVPVAVNGCVWDMSASDLSPDAMAVSFRWAGDSLLSATLPGVRYDFTVAGDTVLRCDSETHFIHLTDTLPQIEAMIFGSVPVSAPYSSVGRAFQSEYIAGEGVASLSPLAIGTLVLPGGDTIPSVLLSRLTCRQTLAFDNHRVPDMRLPADTLSARLSRTTVAYVWQSAGYIIPLARTTVLADTIAGQPCMAAPRVTTWVCPPSSQLSVRAEQARRTPDSRWRPDSYSRPGSNGGDGVNNGLLPPSVDLKITDTTVTVKVSGSGESTAESGYEMILSDAVGRVFASCHSADSAPVWTIDRAALPPGDYILYVSSGNSAPATNKFMLH